MATMFVEPQYLDPGQLASALRHPGQKDRVLIVDVRDEDFDGGHIRGAVNVPSDQWYEDPNVDALIDQHLPGKDMVVVHCMFSQQRGPRCATRLAKRLSTREGSPSPAVYVLRGGFVTFARHYKHENDLVEGYDASHWTRTC